MKECIMDSSSEVIYEEIISRAVPDFETRSCSDCSSQSDVSENGVAASRGIAYRNVVLNTANSSRDSKASIYADMQEVIEI